MFVLVYTTDKNKLRVQHRTGAIFQPVNRHDLIASGNIHRTEESANKTLKCMAPNKRKRMKVYPYEEALELLGL